VLVFLFNEEGHLKESRQAGRVNFRARRKRPMRIRKDLGQELAKAGPWERGTQEKGRASADSCTL
jgi:hypothetical protein